MDQTNNDDKIITDETIHEAMPTAEEVETTKAPLTEGEAEATVGGDAPVDEVTNMNNEDEEAEKEAPAI